MSGSRKAKGRNFKNKKEKRRFDDNLSEELYEAIECLTHSGKKELCPEQFQKVKNICRQSDKYVIELYEHVFSYLNEQHAEVRFSAFQICDDIFRRSHCFREKVIFDLEKVVELTTSNDLPPPESVARELKRFTLRAIHEWNDKFGDNDVKLRNCYNFLRNVKKVDFVSLNIVDTATQSRLEENRRRLENLNKHRVKKVLDEVKEKEADIQAAATSLSNCINLLLPHPDDFFIPESEDSEVLPTSQRVLPTSQRVLPTSQFKHEPSHDSDDEEGSQDAGLREVGLLGFNHSIQVDFTPSSEACIEETPENKDIIENTREYARLVKNKYLPSVKAWLEVLSKSSTHQEDYRRLVALRGELEDLMFKFEQMTFIHPDDVSSDSELEEVPSLPDPKPPERQELTDPTLWSITSQDTSKGDHTSAGSSVSIMHEPADKSESQALTSEPSSSSSSSERKRKLLAVAPKLPFDVDLYHWEDEKLPVPTMVANSTEGHRFWLGAESCMEELPVPEGSAALRTRVIEFSGSFRPVQHSCRVRLPSGKLCPRRDRVKCPFHGEIVPRDEKGECVNPADAVRLQALAEKRQQQRPDWQDPKLLADIKKATGIDLKMPEKGKRKKKKKEYPGLTDLKERENTTTKRLEKKIFKKSVMRKVASAMDRLDQRKFNDKFGDQFQYFYS